jgi:hypothetical protein
VQVNLSNSDWESAKIPESREADTLELAIESQPEEQLQVIETQAQGTETILVTTPTYIRGKQ